jgi:peptidoglycan-associated lipoprotein
LIGSFILTGCPPKKKLAITDQKKVEVKDEKKEDQASEKAPGDIEINQEWSEIPALGMIHFSFDLAALDDVARATLKKNVALIKKLPATVTVRVEGFCDDRGTVEYNIALGQRRANAVKSYYVTAGIAKSRLETISYGEERPLCNFQTDDCWAQNRRGVTKVKNKEAITIKADDLK